MPAPMASAWCLVLPPAACIIPPAKHAQNGHISIFNTHRPRSCFRQRELPTSSKCKDLTSTHGAHHHTHERLHPLRHLGPGEQCGHAFGGTIIDKARARKLLLNNLVVLLFSSIRWRAQKNRCGTGLFEGVVSMAHTWCWHRLISSSSSSLLLKASHSFDFTRGKIFSYRHIQIF